MSVNRIASRYAKSLIDLAVDQDNLEKIHEDISSFKKATENRDLHLMLKSPIVNVGKKRQVFEALFGDKYDKLTKAFFDIILTKGREMYLPEIADAFLLQYKVLKHISIITLTTAVPLGAESLSAIKQELLKSVATDDNVDIETKVDPNILGGFIIEFDDRLYDASVSHKLEKLKKQFSENLYVNNV